MNNKFLTAVETFNDVYGSIKMGARLQPIALPFWSIDEIEKRLSLREEWNVPSNLIPFQGDWHELLCLDQDTGLVVYLNDEREIAFSWKNTDAFIASLSKDEVKTDAERNIKHARIDSEL